MEETITITKKEYEGLLDDYFFLMCLNGAGVDNWSGYGDAQKTYQEELQKTKQE
jgi:hypothetical protein